MAAYVPPHLRNKGGGASAAPAPGGGRSLASVASPAGARFGGGRGGGGGAGSTHTLMRHGDTKNDGGVGALAQQAGRMMDLAPPMRQTGEQDARFSSAAPQQMGDRRQMVSSGDARVSRPPERYVSAYEDQRRLTHEGAAAAAASATTEEGARMIMPADPTEQYAKLVDFSRFRREALGMRREADPASAAAPRKKQSAPRAFGTNDHGRGMEVGDDLPGGTRCDDEGMVYAMDDGTSCVFFCDRFRRYKFFCKAGGLALLRGLVSVNRRNLAANAALFALDAAEAARQRAEGYALYEEKPNLRRQRLAGNEIGTWSDAEYGLPGFQWMYLRLKSFQRFTETWGLLERAKAAGVFEASGGNTEEEEEDVEPLRVVSLGGGPGYELLAYDFFDRCQAFAGLPAADAHIAGRAAEWVSAAKSDSTATYVSLDQQPSWATYVDHLGYDFAQWDVHARDAEEAVLAASTRVVCLLSNIMCYCTDDQTADLFTRLLASGRCRAILANERGAEQGIIPMLERRGVVVLRLLDQRSSGRDDRQFAALPPGTKLTADARNNIPLKDDFFKVFPNAPYEEKKGVKRVA